VQHLIAVLKEHYELSIDWTGTKFIGLTLDWDYVGRAVHLSMPGYVEKMLVYFNHEHPKQRQHSPHSHIPPTYGVKAQYANNPVDSPLLSKEDKTYV
jgi:hypothetical protein